MIMSEVKPRPGEWPGASGLFCVVLARFQVYWYKANQIQYDAGRGCTSGIVNVDTGVR